MKRIDVHNHFLPGIDDGCRSVEESLNCLRQMVAHGYVKCFCTPHSGSTEFTDLTTEDTVRYVNQLRPHVQAAGIPIEIRPGGELRITPDMPEHLRETGIPTFGMDGKYVLADIWERDWPQWAVRGVEWLQKQGKIVILAHPERMPCIREQPTLLDEIARTGVLFQGNLAPVGGRDQSPDINALAQRFLQDGRYFLLGSDGHRAETLPFRLMGLAKATELVGPAKVEELTEKNPALLWT